MASFPGKTVLISTFVALLAVAIAYGLARPLSFTEIPQRLAAYRVSLHRASERRRLTDAERERWTQQWILTASEAAQILEDTDAVLLDPRTAALSRIPGAIPIAWSAFTPTNTVNRGKLLDKDRKLASRLGALGISNDVPVLVAGDPAAWGEDGRIVWMLRTLGHPAAAMVDGGHQALVATVKSGVQVTQPAPASFEIRRNETWSISRDRLQASLSGSAPDGRQLVVLDSRSDAEYRGETPYGEMRGGHIPGAIHLHFKSLMDDSGFLLPRRVVLDRLAAAGITRDKTVVTYCTGGVRSAWLTVVLTELGFDAKNYPGSMWEWALSPPERYPLIKQNP